MNRPNMLQKHRLKAFQDTLIVLNDLLTHRITFLTDFADVYKLPKGITRKNLKTLNEFKKAAATMQKIRPGLL